MVSWLVKDSEVKNIGEVVGRLVMKVSVVCADEFGGRDVTGLEVGAMVVLGGTVCGGEVDDEEGGGGVSDEEVVVKVVVGAGRPGDVVLGSAVKVRVWPWVRNMQAAKFAAA